LTLRPEEEERVEKKKLTRGKFGATGKRVLSILITIQIEKKLVPKKKRRREGKREGQFSREKEGVSGRGLAVLLKSGANAKNKNREGKSKGNRGTNNQTSKGKLLRIQRYSKGVRERYGGRIKRLPNLGGGGNGGGLCFVKIPKRGGKIAIKGQTWRKKKKLEFGGTPEVKTTKCFEKKPNYTYRMGGINRMSRQSKRRLSFKGEIGGEIWIMEQGNKTTRSAYVGTTGKKYGFKAQGTTRGSQDAEGYRSQTILVG